MAAHVKKCREARLADAQQIELRGDRLLRVQARVRGLAARVVRRLTYLLDWRNLTEIHHREVHQLAAHGVAPFVDLIREFMPGEVELPLRPHRPRVHALTRLNERYREGIAALKDLPRKRAPATSMRQIAFMDYKRFYI